MNKADGYRVQPPKQQKTLQKETLSNRSLKLASPNVSIRPPRIAQQPGSVRSGVFISAIKLNPACSFQLGWSQKPLSTPNGDFQKPDTLFP
jgi:hypothetical protein